MQPWTLIRQSWVDLIRRHFPRLRTALVADNEPSDFHESTIMGKLHDEENNRSLKNQKRRGDEEDGGLEGRVGGEVETFKGGEEGKIESTSRRLRVV